LGTALANLAAVVGICGGLITIFDRVAKGRQHAAAENSEDAQSRRSGWAVWTVGEKTLTATVAGIAIYVIIAGIATWTNYPNFGPIQFISLAQATALIMGVWYGPWVGLATGVIGYALTVVFTLETAHNSGPKGSLRLPFPPAFSVGDGFVGLAGGLLILYLGVAWARPTVQQLAVCSALAGGAVVIGDLLSEAVLQHQGGGQVVSALAQDVLSDVLCAITLLIAALHVHPPGALRSPPTDPPP
jgi:hypothetical protein